LYDRCGFLYPAKKTKISSYYTKIKQNWEKALLSKDDIIWIFTNKHPDTSKMASVCYWRSGMNSVTVQHQISERSPLGSRSVMLGASRHAIVNNFKSAQICYNPSNKYASRVWDGMEEYLKNDVIFSRHFYYFSVYPSDIVVPKTKIMIKKLYNGQEKEAFETVKMFLGRVYAHGEEFDDDVEIKKLDEIYKKTGLSRKRFVWVAYLSGRSDPVCIAISYRAPLGLNFSFIENSTLILCDNSLNDTIQGEIFTSLLANVSNIYQDFLPGYIPVLTDKKGSLIMSKQHHNFMREYKKIMWLDNGFIDTYKYIEDIFFKIYQRYLQSIQLENKILA
jgi:hypothetical protein